MKYCHLGGEFEYFAEAHFHMLEGRPYPMFARYVYRFEPGEWGFVD